jgi:hypothetical protein
MELGRLRAVILSVGDDYVRLRDKLARYEEEMDDWAFDYSGIPELKFSNEPEPQAQEPQPQPEEPQHQPQGAGAGPQTEGENMGIDQ